MTAGRGLCALGCALDVWGGQAASVAGRLFLAGELDSLLKPSFCPTPGLPRELESLRGEQRGSVAPYIPAKRLNGPRG